MQHGTREGLAGMVDKACEGPVGVDETNIGGPEKNKRQDKKLHAGWGRVGKKSIVIATQDRDTNEITAKVIGNTTKSILRHFANTLRKEGASVFMVEHSGCQGAIRALLSESRHGAVHGLWTAG